MKQAILCGGLLAFLGAASASAGVATVWAVSDGEKVERDDRAHPLKAKNAVWDGRGVRLAAARNEIVAFQVIVEADGSGIGALSAALPQLRRRDGSERIAYAPPAADPTLYAGRPIQLFSVRDMNVTQETHASWAWKPGSPAAPKRHARLAAGAARARERPGGPRRLPARGRAGARPGDLDRGLRRTGPRRRAATTAR